MIAAESLARSAGAGEHLQLLRALARELERAMQAIAGNRLGELEDSVMNQQEISQQLSEAADLLREAALAQKAAPAGAIEADLMREIREACAELNRLNRRYAILLKYSSRSVAVMAALFNSYRGQIQEASGSRFKHQTWSCRM